MSVGDAGAARPGPETGHGIAIGRSYTGRFYVRLPLEQRGELSDACAVAIAVVDELERRFPPPEPAA